MKILIIVIACVVWMSLSQKLIIGFASFPERALAKTVAVRLVKEKLAACVKIIDGIESIYEWENKVEEAKEYYLMIKTSETKAKEIDNVLKQTHPYKTYEFIYTNVDGGNETYMEWIRQVTKNRKNEI